MIIDISLIFISDDFFIVFFIKEKTNRLNIVMSYNFLFFIDTNSVQYEVLRVKKLPLYPQKIHQSPQQNQPIERKNTNHINSNLMC